ncbi:N-acetylmuramoyl-L-alanine amidase [Clostridium brassicae]|uniref:N-acetylmuramoyl-L-alanine amidase n=1 Tax=Clostridium brassicae TaxID=2999072 RepID=A0ABT4D451_9CLOT|nr:N-acetylmuramoyl-L-alanine amidase [Clostridium brassicae]MCY6957042.1 N-acetylmuramoyl-L-alanine amidase [Clostridium brassicae]
MKIAVRGGHNPQATGASALIDELTEDRKVYPSVIKYLKMLGHDVLDVTPGPMNRNSDLPYGVNRAKTWGAELFISIHFNKAYNRYKGELGTEAWLNLNNGTTSTIATKITNNIAKLGFRNRGIKDGMSRGLYEIKRNSIPSIIVEVCFVEATKDVELYKKLGSDVIGKVIAEGVGKNTVNNKATSENIESKFKHLPLKCNEDVIAWAKEVKRFKKGDKLTAIDEITNYYRLDLEKGAWIHKDDVEVKGNLDEPYEKRKKLEVIQDDIICWANEVKAFKKGDFITAIDEITYYYQLDINGEKAWVRKDKVKTR